VAHGFFLSEKYSVLYLGLSQRSSHILSFGAAMRAAQNATLLVNIIKPIPTKRKYNDIH